MIVKAIYTSTRFESQFIYLPRAVQKRAVRIESTFRLNPLHPSLRLHQLKGKLRGYWSLSITLNYRIIFYREKNGDIVFISIGTHDIYGSL